MSLTRITGDLKQKFGKVLPVPFIEKVEIFSDTINVNLGLYFEMEEAGEQNKDNFADYLRSLVYDENFGVGLKLQFETTLDPIYSNTISGEASPISGISNSFVYKHQTTGLDLGGILYSWPIGNQDSTFTQNASRVEGTNLFTTMIGSIIRPVTFDQNYSYFYDENNKLIQKLTIPVKIPILNFHQDSNTKGIMYFEYDYGYSGSDLVRTNTNTTIQPISYIEFAESSLGNVNKMGLVSFSYTLNDEQILDLIDLPENDEAYYSSFVSDAAFATIVEQGSVVISDEDVFFDLERNVVENVSIALDGVYHKQSSNTLSNIVQGMSALTQTKTSDSALQNVYDNLNYVLSVYGTKPNLIQQLNKFRKSFPDKSNSTAVGRFYNTFKEKLYSANVLITKGETVKKELVSNPRVLDSREFEEFSSIANQNSQGASIYSGYSTISRHYNDGLKQFNGAWADGFEPAQTNADIVWSSDHHYIYIADSDVWGEIKEVSDGFLFTDRGYFFFDYDKAIRKFSKISYIFSTERIGVFYDSEIFNQTFLLDEVFVKLAKHGTESGDTSSTEGNKYFASNRPGNIIKAKYSDGTNNKISRRIQVVDSSEEIMSTSYGDETSYVALRSFNTGEIDGLHYQDEPYKLMCFEFQKLKFSPYGGTFEGESEDATNFLNLAQGNDLLYLFSVHITDKTARIYTKIKEDLEQVAKDFSDYAEAAAEQCAITSEGLNEYFINGVKERYSDNPLSAPWFKGPFLYEFHKNLLFGSHNNELSNIVASATSLSAMVSPDSGVKEQIEAFNENLQTLFNDYYDSDLAKNDSPQKRFEEVDDETNEVRFGSSVDELQTSAPYYGSGYNFLLAPSDYNEGSILDADTTIAPGDLTDELFQRQRTPDPETSTMVDLVLYAMTVGNPISYTGTDIKSYYRESNSQNDSANDGYTTDVPNPSYKGVLSYALQDDNVTQIDNTDYDNEAFNTALQNIVLPSGYIYSMPEGGVPFMFDTDNDTDNLTVEFFKQVFIAWQDRIPLENEFGDNSSNYPYSSWEEMIEDNSSEQQRELVVVAVNTFLNVFESWPGPEGESSLEEFTEDWVREVKAAAGVSDWGDTGRFSATGEEDIIMQDRDASADYYQTGIWPELVSYIREKIAEELGF